MIGRAADALLRLPTFAFATAVLAITLAIAGGWFAIVLAVCQAIAR